MANNEVVVDGEVVHCVGCGAAVQTTDKDALGYTPASALKKGLENGEVYCQRCFRLRHYNEIAPVSLSDDDFLKLLTSISDTDSLIVYVVDIFDVNGSMIPGVSTRLRPSFKGISIRSKVVPGNLDVVINSLIPVD